MVILRYETLVGLAEHGFPGDEAKLEMLETNISFERQYRNTQHQSKRTLNIQC